MLKRIISAILLAAFSIGAVACSTDSDVSSDTSSADTTTVSESTAVEYDEYGREIITHSLPELDYNGAEVSMIARDAAEYSTDLYVESENGELVNDAIYARNRTVEETLNVKLKMNFAPNTNTTTTEAVGDKLRAAFYAGEQAYDIAAYFLSYGGSSLGLEGLLYNLHDIENLDLTKPWWNKSFVDEVSLYGTLFGIVGDINLSAVTFLRGIFFNKRLADEYVGGEAALYDYVYNGEWTIDKFTEIGGSIRSDLNGDSVYDENDFYGIFGRRRFIDAWTAALGVTLVTKNSAGDPEITMYSEHSVEAFDKLVKFYNNNDGVFLESEEGTQDKGNAFFVAGNCIFYMYEMQSATNAFRDMEDPYGVLPIPKFDEAQEGYYTSSQDACNLISITSNTKDPAMTGAVLELMCYETWKSVTPAYFEIAMKDKYLADNDSAVMFDIIREGAKFDFGLVYTMMLSGNEYSMDTAFVVKFRNLIRLDLDFTSNYAQNEELYKTQLEYIIEEYKKLG